MQRKLSVVLPTYEEAGNIVRLVNAILDAVPSVYRVEIIVVDDNSPDGTLAKVRESFAGDERVIPVLRTSDRGFAKSIRAGIERATGDKVIVMDTDFTHDPGEIPRLLHVGEVYDMVSASRFCPGGAMQDVKHYISSLAFNWFLRVLLRTQVQDNLGGYFLLDRRVLDGLPFDRIFQGYGEYFFRLLHFVQGKGCSIVEIPAVYRVRVSGDSKSTFLKMLFTYSFAALRLRLTDR
jgi:dolichol-phosphate mannosyltransferase